MTIPVGPRPMTPFELENILKFVVLQPARPCVALWILVFDNILQGNGSMIFIDPILSNPIFFSMRFRIPDAQLISRSTSFGRTLLPAFDFSGNDHIEEELFTAVYLEEVNETESHSIPDLSHPVLGFIIAGINREIYGESHI
ncbi:unnamed protein product [Caenorhabditis bovis]|uniref:Uncharacterized protein n=1 Tax=Caenorhabditis bovis TaxID=2654633 RepID=A0A8S1EWI7_9PELO|nr:unnamed protein product [Caenorhabditis bovis]